MQLLSRHWIITDATGHIEEVKGAGRRRRAAGAAARRVVPVHVRLPAEDVDRRDARHLSDGHRRRRPLRRRDRALRPPRALHRSLTPQRRTATTIVRRVASDDQIVDVAATLRGLRGSSRLTPAAGTCGSRRGTRRRNRRPSSRRRRRPRADRRASSAGARTMSRSVVSWKITYGGTPRSRASRSRTSRSTSKRSRVDAGRRGRRALRAAALVRRAAATSR